MSLSEPFDKARKSQQRPHAAMAGLQLWLSHYNGMDDSLDYSPIAIDRPLVLPENWGPPAGEQREPTARIPSRSTANFEPGPVSGETWDHFLEHLLDREGYRNKVYLDSEGKATVGVGHLVKAEDNLRVGDVISDERVREFLEADAAKAYKAAAEQANELGINDSDFLIALGSVNYQLGTGWRDKFPQTWAHMENGNFDQAIANIEVSLWSRQTPLRTADFTQAIRDVKDDPGAFSVAAIDTNFNAQAEGAPLSASEPTPATAPDTAPLQTMERTI